MRTLFNWSQIKPGTDLYQLHRQGFPLVLRSNNDLMRSILVPVDFSATSRNALTYAAHLSGHMNAELILFHAYMLPTPVSEAPYVMVTAEEMEKERASALQTEMDYAATLTGKQASGYLRLGIASDEIRELIREKNVDLIIMGMKGSGGLEKLMGSTTTNVIRKIKTPVLVVPENARYQPIQKVLYPSDFSYKTTHHLYDRLLEIIDAYRARLSILHISFNHSGETPEKLMQKKEMGQVFRSVNYDFLDKESHSVTQGINEYLADNPIDLIAMVAHQHSFLERLFSKSHTNAIVYESNLPLLVLQDKE